MHKLSIKEGCWEYNESLPESSEPKFVRSSRFFTLSYAGVATVVLIVELFELQFVAMEPEIKRINCHENVHVHLPRLNTGD